MTLNHRSRRWMLWVPGKDLVRFPNGTTVHSGTLQEAIWFNPPGFFSFHLRDHGAHLKNPKGMRWVDPPLGSDHPTWKIHILNPKSWRWMVKGAFSGFHPVIQTSRGGKWLVSNPHFLVVNLRYSRNSH